MSTDQISPVEERMPAATLIHTVTAHGCTDCGAPMASEQRYCVSCGSRRGKPRFSAESLAGSTSPAATQRADLPAQPAARSTTATVLIASVGTLLLAMGVGVLIGHNGSSSPQKAAAPQVITVGGSAAAPSSSATDGKAKTAKHGSKSTAKKAKTTVVHISPGVEKKAAEAASKALGGGAPKEPTVGVGEKCNADTAGCKNGKFSGDFFGP